MSLVLRRKPVGLLSFPGPCSGRGIRAEWVHARDLLPLPRRILPSCSHPVPVATLGVGRGSSGSMRSRHNTVDSADAITRENHGHFRHEGSQLLQSRTIGNHDDDRSRLGTDSSSNPVIGHSTPVAPSPVRASQQPAPSLPWPVAQEVSEPVYSFDVLHQDSDGDTGPREHGSPAQNIRVSLDELFGMAAPLAPIRFLESRRVPARYTSHCPAFGWSETAANNNAPIRRAVFVKCRTSSARSLRPMTVRSR